MKPPLCEVWSTIASFPNLAAAHRFAMRGKSARTEVARFHLRWEWEVAALEEELVAMTWQPGPLRSFQIYEGKSRTISAVPYRDRVVHHAIMNILGPHLEGSFVNDTYACRVGKGTEAARCRVQHYLRSCRYLLHLDVRRFFPSIPHSILKRQLATHVGDRCLLEILHRILDHDGRDMADDLVELAERRGLPIGSLTSQWLANLYLSPLDHLIKDQLGVPGYVRYMDDMVLLAGAKATLWEAEEAVRRFASDRLELELHATPRFAPTSEGLSFLGMYLYREHRRLLPPSGYRFRRRAKGALRRLRTGLKTREQVRAQFAGWLGHARLANTVALRRAIFDELAQGHHPGARTA